MAVNTISANQVQQMLARIDELVEIAKKYVKMGYDPIEAIKLAEKKIYEKYLNS